MVTKPVTQKDIETYAVSALKKWLKKAMSFSEVRKRLVALEAKTYQVDISIVSDLKMAKINHAFRKVKKPTDILSFPTHEFFQRQGVLGDLVLCGPIALEQAKSLGHSWKKEIDVLLTHGILHLLHFDHETSSKDSDEMSRWEIKILGKDYAKTLIARTHEEAAHEGSKRKSASPKTKRALSKSPKTEKPVIRANAVVQRKLPVKSRGTGSSARDRKYA